MPRTLSLLAGLLAMIASPLLARPTDAAPSAKVRERVAHYLAAVESPSAAQAFQDQDMTAEAAAAAPPGAVAAYFAGQKRVLGGFDLLGLRMVSPRRAEVLLRDRIYGARHGLTMDFEAGPEARTTEFDPGPAPLWAPPLPRTLSTDMAAQAAQRLAERGCAVEVFSGAVLVARGDRVLVEHACGLASRRYGVPNTADTRFNLGSINKMFTAVAAMQLVEAGKVSLDDPLDR